MNLLITLFLLAVIVLITPSPGVSQETNEGFLYLNENGEEIFGPEYQPEPPEDDGLAYLIGRPMAGYRGVDFLMSLPQSAFMPSFDQQSLPKEGNFIRTSPGVPLRKEFEEGMIFEGPSPLVVPFNNQTQSNQLVPVSEMIAHFVEVGQGDGAILEFPCGVTVIDLGGEYGSGQGKVDGGMLFVEYLVEFFADRPHLNDTIDVVFLTHPHADHINGLKYITNSNSEFKFKINAVVDNGQTGDRGSLKKQTQFRERQLIVVHCIPLYVFLIK